MKSAAAATEDYDEVALDATRLDELMALVEEASWNQLPADWQIMIREGTGIGRARRRDGTLVGSAVVLPLGPELSWIGMVLVAGSERRRGHATWLMNRCMAHIEAAGTLAGLDATPAGRQVYRKLGFEDVSALRRMGCSAPRRSGGPQTDTRPVEAPDLDRLAEYDRSAFGADRSAILRDLYRRMPGCAFLAEYSGRLAGFVLGRAGRLATHIGPLVADDLVAAKRLLIAALGATSGQVIVDAFCERPELDSFLRSLGFEEQRPFARMLKGRSLPVYDPSRAFMAAGPELG